VAPFGEEEITVVVWGCGSSKSPGMMDSTLGSSRISEILSKVIL